MAGAAHNAAGEVVAYEEDRQPVKLVHDTWTPRSHFIAVQCNPKQTATTAELQVMYEIIGRFLQNNPQFEKEAILSFHGGKWYQKHTGKWHAHLCVSRQPYLDQARAAITVI